MPLSASIRHSEYTKGHPVAAIDPGGWGGVAAPWGWYAGAVSHSFCVGGRPAPSEDALVRNVSTLLTEPLGSTRTYEFAEAHFRFGPAAAPVSGRAQFTRTDGSVMVSAALALTIQEVCARCLESFALPLTLEFQEEFWPAFDPLTREPIQVPEGREGFPVVEGLLDLREALRQNTEMARPMQPCCRAECAGPAGGESALGRPSTPPADDRWAALRDLRGELR